MKMRKSILYFFAPLFLISRDSLEEKIKQEYKQRAIAKKLKVRDE